MDKHGYWLSVSAVLAVLGVTLPGCTTEPVGYDTASADASGCVSVGILRLAGAGHVSHNGGQASDGAPVCSGDHVTTGPSSSAYLFSPRGGYVQLDQSTDSLFDVLPELAIEVISVNRGQLFLLAPAGGQVRIIGPNGDVETLGAQLNLRINRGMSVLTLIQGRARLTRPEAAKVSSKEQIGYRGGRLSYRRELSAPMLSQVTRWRTNYPMPEAILSTPDDDRISADPVPWWLLYGTDDDSTGPNLGGYRTKRDQVRHHPRLDERGPPLPGHRQSARDEFRRPLTPDHPDPAPRRGSERPRHDAFLPHSDLKPMPQLPDRGKSQSPPRQPIPFLPTPPSRTSVDSETHPRPPPPLPEQTPQPSKPPPADKPPPPPPPPPRPLPRIGGDGG
jgi:hypothetical protein